MCFLPTGFETGFWLNIPIMKLKINKLTTSLKATVRIVIRNIIKA